MKKSEAEKIYRLLEEWTRADVMSRLAPINFPAFADYAMIAIEKENEIREILFGTSSLAELYSRWFETKFKKKKKKKKRR